jgi:hypothetical protein
MNPKSYPTKSLMAEKKTSSTYTFMLRSALLLFLLFFPVTFMSMFLHEAGHAIFHLTQGVPVHFLYAHPFSFLGFVRPMADYNNVWVHASGTVFELLVSGVIFVLLWKRRSFYTLPFLMIFPWVALYDGLGGIFDILGHTGDYYNILTITRWSPLNFYVISLILSVVGIFFLFSLFPLLGLKPDDRKSLFVLPAGMLLYTALGLLIANLFVTESPIDVQYYLAHEIILSAYYRPIFMGSIGILLALIYITLYRSLYRRIHASLRTENVDLTWKNLRLPTVLATVSVILGILIIT